MPGGGSRLSPSERHSLLGLPVDVAAIDRAADLCAAAIEDGGPPLRVLTLNPEMAMQARSLPELAGCFTGRTLVVPDGIGIVLAGWRRRWPKISRVPGIELLERLVAEAATRSWVVFLYGGKPGMAEQAAAVLRGRYPELVVGGTAHGYLSAEQEAQLPERIRETGAKLIFVGLGVPRQELWLLANLEAAGARLGMGVGGSFDVIAGRIPRAPAIMRRLGLEWAYRVWREPRRWRRLLVLPRFLWHAVAFGERRRSEG